MSRLVLRLVGLRLLAAVCLAGTGLAQSGAAAPFTALNEAEAPTALVRSVKISAASGPPAVEIIATRPLVPAIAVLENPARLVIDLPKSLISAPQRILSRSGGIGSVRVSQFQKDPPVARVVLDLSRASGYSWDEAGNRLMIRLQPKQNAKSEVLMPPVTSTDRGAVVLASGRSPMDSSISAGADTAVLHLAHGREVRVCPGTTVSVTASQNGRDILLGMSTGALEAHYALQSAAGQSSPERSSADSLLTPDFRIVPEGSGEFNYAVSADSRGNTCVRALPGNTALAQVFELMGGGAYRVKAAERVVFRGGRLAEPGTEVPADCGCPVGQSAVLRAGTRPGESGTRPGQAADGGVPSASPDAPETAPLPASQPKDVHVQIDAPFVFRASDAPPSSFPALEAASLPVAGARRPDLYEIAALPPTAGSGSPIRRERQGLLTKMKSFLAGVFR